MTKVRYCYAVYHARRDLVGQPILINGLLLVDVGEAYYFAYTDEWSIMNGLI
jgi:hypothetical protein